MFDGFKKDAFEFLMGIRCNNDREWFEPRKKIYTETVYEPLKALTPILFKPYENSGMIAKTGRIYRDEAFPPYLHYRDTLWIYVRYEAYHWNRTPTFYFEISPEGAEFGFRIAKPEASVMEEFRRRIAENPEKFLTLAESLKKQGITFGGEEYKRKKPCTVPEAEEFFAKKGLSAYVKTDDMALLGSPELADEVLRVFRLTEPLNELFHEIVLEAEVKRAERELKILEDSAPLMINETVKAPDHDFMW